MLNSIKIDPEFEKLIPPLADDEFLLLEENIIREGKIFAPIFTWNGFIIDGHHRYKILIKHREIKYETVEKNFANKYEVMKWICLNQLGRRNLTDEDRKYVVGKRYEAEKLAYGASDGFRGNKHTKLLSGQNDHLVKKEPAKKTRAKIADEIGTTESYVRRATEFARGVDAAEEAVPGIKKEILSGKLKRPAKEIAAIAKVPIEKRKELTENLRQTRVSVKADAEGKKAIKNIGEAMHSSRSPNKEDIIYVSLEGAVDMFIDTCKNIFSVNPELLENEQYKDKTMEILQKAVKYILKMKEV